MVNITFIKLGNITLTTLVDIMLDERASRTDINCKVISSSTKLKETNAQELIDLLEHIPTDLVVAVSPNANLEGPKFLVEKLKGKYPLIVISDEADKELRASWKEAGIGYMIAPFDPMIGAKKDFLDPSEMGIFNGHIISAFSACGVFTFITKQLDSVIENLKNSEEPKLPFKLLSSKAIVTDYPFSNGYSASKAMAALEILKQAGKQNVNGMYVEKDRNVSLIKLAAAHEMVRQASLLADEIRELEKGTNHLVKLPHAKDGKWLHKLHFYDEAHKKQ